MSYLDDFLAKGDNAPSTPPAEQRRRLADAEARNAESNAYDPNYHAPYGKGSGVAFTPTCKESKT